MPVESCVEEWKRTSPQTGDLKNPVKSCSGSHWESHVSQFQEAHVSALEGWAGQATSLKSQWWGRKSQCWKTEESALEDWCPKVITKTGTPLESRRKTSFLFSFHLDYKCTGWHHLHQSESSFFSKPITQIPRTNSDC